MKITNWDTVYENAQSRKVHRLSWVPVPNKHDGERYSELMATKDSAEIFAAWILILQVASRSQHRGSLLRDNGKCHTPESLALKTRGKVEWFKKAIPYLLQIGWLEGVMEDASSALPERSQSAGLEGKGTEQNRTEDICDRELKFMNSIGSLYKRRESTPWDGHERKKLKEVLKRPDCETELGEIEKLYGSGYKYRRQNIITLLNNWAGEVDRARGVETVNGKKESDFSGWLNKGK